MQRVAVYAGSFDPPTLGHVYMIEEGAKLFDELVVAIGINPDKKTTFDVEARIALLEALTERWPHVRVDTFQGYLVHYARTQGATHLLRGLRSTQDFEYENTMRQVNAQLAPEVSSVFLLAPRDLADTSSSFVKGLVGPPGWEAVVERFVPPAVHRALVERFGGA